MEVISSLLKSWGSKSFLAIAVVGSLGGCAWLIWRSRGKKWVKVGTVDKLYLFPLKGCRANDLPMAEFDKLAMKAGPLTDRNFMLMNDRYPK